MTAVPKNKPITYERAKALARSTDAEVRQTLAARADIEPEILYFLAEDGEPEVRRAIAANEATPRLADLLLTDDESEDVRVDLAGKIARLAPGLTDREQDKVHQLTYEALEKLARDRATRVRQVLAKALKDVADAPPEVIRRLARDIEIVVAGPVLENSPVLTDDDILAIIAADPVFGALRAISRRSGLSAEACDAVAASDDTEAIADVLANPSAQIQEETLDRILDRAPKVKLWHAPLVRRPKLPDDAAIRLSRFVANKLVDMLMKRDDLPPAALEQVRTVVGERIEAGDLDASEIEAVAAEDGEDAADAADDDDDDDEHDPVFRRAKEMQETGKLNAKAVSKAIDKGDGALAADGLALLTGARLAQVKRLIATADAKPLVALAWKAGVAMAAAQTLQKDIAKVPAKKLVKADAKGEYPMSEDDMEWQLELLGLP